MDHTPGPWRVEQVEGSFQVPFHVLSGKKLVAVCTGDQLNPEGPSVYQSRINAALIAAAPELLDACKGLIESILSVFSTNESMKLMKPRLLHGMDAAKAAINKAEGRTA